MTRAKLRLLGACPHQWPDLPAHHLDKMGSENTASGNASYFWTSTGGLNTASGYVTGYTNTTGSPNTFLGATRDASARDLTNATTIGFGAVVEASNGSRSATAPSRSSKGRWRGPGPPMSASVCRVCACTEAKPPGLETQPGDRGPCDSIGPLIAAPSGR
jgi:hypothetical protein